MTSEETTTWLNTVAVLAVVGSGLYMLYVGLSGSTPALSGFENGFVLVALTQLFAGISLWVNEPTLDS